jgi:hypothetical protein
MLSTSRPAKIDPAVLKIKKDFGKFRISTKEALMYALAIGFNMGKKN